MTQRASTHSNKGRTPRNSFQAGYLLLAVSMALLAISLFALSAVSISQGEAQQRFANSETAQLHYAAQAGLAHTEWQLQQVQTCNGYSSLSATQFEGFRYKTSVSPATGSPVSILSVATDSSGNKVTLSKPHLPVLRTPETVVIAPGKQLDDTSVDGADTDRSDGNRNDLRVGSFSPNYALLRFDLSAVPNNVRVLSATLTLNYESVVAVQSGASVAIHPMLEPWVEDDASFDEGLDGVPWSWPDAYDVDEPFGFTPLDGVAFGPLDFDVTRLVSAWKNAELPNHGMALVSAGGVNFAKFTSGDDADISIQPQLSVTFACECGVICAPAPPALDLLMIVGNGDNPEGKDDDRAELVESWGWTVTFIDDGADSADIVTAAADADAVLVSATVDDNRLNGELEDLPIGIVSEDADLLVEHGFATQFFQEAHEGVVITDTTHYITEGLRRGELLEITDRDETYHGLRGALSSDMQILAAMPGPSVEPSLAVLEAGGLRHDGNVSIARRVNLAWAGDDDGFDPKRFTRAGQQLLRRSLEWAAASGISVGDYRDSLRYQTCVAETDYAGSDGQLDWSLDVWQEILDDGLPCSGTMQVRRDPSSGDADSYQLMFYGNDTGFERRVDISAFSSATLRFKTRAVDFFIGVHRIAIEASSDGINYDNVGVVTHLGTNSNYVNNTIDLNAYAGAPVFLRFLGRNLGGSSVLFLDDLIVEDN